MNSDTVNDDLLSKVLSSGNQSLPCFFDAVFGFLSRNNPESLISSDGIALEHILSQSITKWRLKLANNKRLSESLSAVELTNDLHENPPLATEAIEVPSGAVIDCSSDIVEEVVTSSTIGTEKPTDQQTQPSYYWSQTIEDLDIRIPVPSNITKGKQMVVSIMSSHVSVAIRGGGVLLKGNLHKNINASESLWDLSPKQFITLHLYKQDSVWWPVRNAIEEVEGEVEGAIEAERPYHSLPQEDQADINKIMFDAHQKAAGKPTSDVLKMENMLKQAWDVEGSPFKGEPFDLSKVNVVPQQ